MPPPLDPAKRAAILADIRAGGHSCRGLARKHGVSDHAVRKIAAQEGIENAWSRAQTEKATAARAADNAAERATLAAESLTAARAALRRTVEALPEASARDAAVAYGILVDKHRALVDMDRDPEGLAAVDAWLRGITGQ